MSKKFLGSKSHYWCFTNNEVGTYKTLAFVTRQGNQVTPTYYVIGIEHAPTTGKEHEQGYVEFDREVTGHALVSAFPASIGNAVQVHHSKLVITARKKETFPKPGL